jgi:hypothetical protein
LLVEKKYVSPSLEEGVRSREAGQTTTDNDNLSHVYEYEGKGMNGPVV